MSLAPVYRRTVFETGGTRLRVGQTSAALGRLTGRQAGVFVTAWNPFSRRMPLGWNLRANRRLQTWLRRFETGPAVGSLQGWHEVHVFVVADERRIIQIARRFRQLAIVVIRPGQPLRLVWIA